MKGLRLLTLLALSFTIILDSCKKKEEEASSATTSYKNQDLQGVINEKPWEYALGAVFSNADFDDSTKFEHSFFIIDTAQADTCSALTGKRPLIIFTISDSNPLLLKGSHSLKYDPNSWENTISVTINYRKAGSTSTEHDLVTDGTYEILSVDTTAQIVTGRMKVTFEGIHSLNGNFTVKYCYW